MPTESGGGRTCLVGNTTTHTHAVRSQRRHDIGSTCVPLLRSMCAASASTLSACLQPSRSSFLSLAEHYLLRTRITISEKVLDQRSKFLWASSPELAGSLIRTNGTNAKVGNWCQVPFLAKVLQ